MIVVTAAIAIKEGKLLLARRAPGQSLEGYWEFPGGKVEPGETLQECLARELDEELGAAAIVGDVYAESVYHYDRGSIRLVGLLADIPQEHFKLSVHDQIEWVPIGHLAGYDLAPADVAIANQLMQDFVRP